MANKKISQLSSIDGAIGISTSNLLPIASGSAGNYVTAKVNMEQIQDFILSPMNTSSNQDIGFTGSENVVFKKTNWENANTNVEVNPYLQVRISDGQLITGSGAAVPAALGDNLGDHTATEDLNLANYGVINTNDIFFGGGTTVSTRIEYQADPGIKDLKVQAERDLTLSGYRHVNISGQALDLANTPISGNVTITGGNLEIDPGNKLIVNEIKVARGTATNDSGSLVIEGASRHEPYNIDGFGNVYWTESNIQYDTVNTASPEFDFVGAGNGQTLTMYVENTSNSVVSTPTFVSGSTTPNPILWGGTGGPPQLEPNRTNVYTFVCLHTGIFASAITGYEY
jgi:hypothetical protein